MKKIISLRKSGRYVVDVPPTGFKSTTNRNKATRFETQEAAKAFMADRGIFTAAIVDATVLYPLTPFEKFVFENGDKISAASIATQTNRTESAVSAAYSRADNKVKNIKATEVRDAALAIEQGVL